MSVNTCQLVPGSSIVLPKVLWWYISQIFLPLNYFCTICLLSSGVWVTLVIHIFVVIDVMKNEKLLTQGDSLSVPYYQQLPILVILSQKMVFRLHSTFLLYPSSSPGAANNLRFAGLLLPRKLSWNRLPACSSHSTLQVSSALNFLLRYGHRNNSSPTITSHNLPHDYIHSCVHSI